MAESYKNISDYSSYFGEIRKIKDGELVDEVVSNRPTMDAQSNIEILGSLVSTIGGSCLGAWDSTVTYQKGDIVSYGSSYFKSLIYDNLGNTPKTLSDCVNYLDNNWKCIGDSNSISGEGFSRNPSILDNEGNPLITTRVSNLPEYSNLPMFLENGKFLKEFSTESRKSYSFIRFSRYFNVDGLYRLIITSDSGVVSCVEFRIKYTGLDCNSSGVKVPEILIGSCSVSNYDVLPPETPYDRYGIYGVCIVSSQNKDGTMGVYISTKENASVRVEGDYKIEPTMDLVYYDNTYFFINHIVRPFGGDNARDEIGKVYNKSYLTLNCSKDAWDCGMLYIGNSSFLVGNVFSLYRLKRGYTNSGSIVEGDLKVDGIKDSYLVLF